jgi:hypothetical protein
VRYNILDYLSGSHRSTGMAEIPLDDPRLKQLFKTAVLEVLEERRDLFRELIVEALEDIALTRAIEAGQRTTESARDEVFSVLEGSH